MVEPRGVAAERRRTTISTSFLSVASADHAANADASRPVPGAREQSLAARAAAGSRCRSQRVLLEVERLLWCFFVVKVGIEIKEG